ncbi:MAG TPA: hypothetical protein VMA74_02675 [Dyella sp.]|uniref:hypothetical protein n=1 Tax=Dyella sp. TaxID=1869338 RepID=UPI002C02674D|nr:hypothetical protein [Dyella sp.]HUB88613.1 hypothetical protein [Dyella sp.]
MRDLPILFSAPMVRAILEGRKTQTRRVMKEQPFSDGYFQGDVCLDQNGVYARFSVEAVGGGGYRSEEYWCPYGDPRDHDRLWVREAWRVPDSLDASSGFDIAEQCISAGYRKPWCPIRYEADGALNSHKDWREFGATPGEATPGRYRHARFMPRWASRITLEVTGVRVERLQDISAADAIAEGIDRVENNFGNRPAFCDYGMADLSDSAEWFNDPTHSFRSLWDSINGAREPKHIRRRRAKGMPVDRPPPTPGPNSWDANPWVWVIEFKRIEVPHG